MRSDRATKASEREARAYCAQGPVRGVGAAANRRAGGGWGDRERARTQIAGYALSRVALLARALAPNRAGGCIRYCQADFSVVLSCVVVVCENVCMRARCAFHMLYLCVNVSHVPCTLYMLCPKSTKVHMCVCCVYTT